MLFNRPLLPKQLGFKKSRLYKQSRVDFYSGRNKISTLSSLKNIIFRDSLNAPRTESEIVLEQFPFGTNLKELIRAKGKPKFSITSDGVIPDHKIYFYRVVVNGVKCIQQFHFFQGQLFFGHVEFRNGNVKLTEQLQQMLASKYQLDSNDINEVVDSNNNSILISGGITLTISYFSGLSDMNLAIKKEIEKIESKKSALQHNNMEKLFDMI